MEHMSDNALGQINHCRVCGAPQPRQFFDLGDQPLANSLLRSPEEKENFLPLSSVSLRRVQFGGSWDIP